MTEEYFVEMISCNYNFLLKDNFKAKKQYGQGSSGNFLRYSFTRGKIIFSFSCSFTINVYYGFNKKEFEHKELFSMLELGSPQFPGFFKNDDEMFEAVKCDFLKIYNKLFSSGKTDKEIIKYVNSIPEIESKFPF